MNGTLFHKGALYGINLARAISDPKYAIYDGDFFTTMAHTSVAAVGGYNSTGADAGAIATVALLPGIALKITTGAGDKNGHYMARQNNVDTGLVGAFDLTIGSGRVLAYESRFKVVEGTEVAIFVGLAEAGALDHDLLTDDTGAIAAKDVIGFHCVSHETDVDIDGITRLAAGDATVGADTMTEDEDDDFQVYGFRFDGNKTIDWYLDNEKVATQTVTALTVASGESLNPIIAIKTGEAVAKSITIDYWQCVELLLSEDNLAD